VIQIEILTGTRAGTRCEARRLPFRIGREKTAALSLADDGIWESHLELSHRPGDGYYLTARPDSLSLVNGDPVKKAVRLANGDLLEAGSVQLRFGLAATRRTAMVWREVLVWTGVALLCLGQIALIYFVLP